MAIFMIKKIYNHDELDHYDIVEFYKFDNDADAKYYFNYIIENNLLPLAHNYFLGKYNLHLSEFEKNKYEYKIKQLEIYINEYKND